MTPPGVGDRPSYFYESAPQTKRAGAGLADGALREPLQPHSGLHVPFILSQTSSTSPWPNVRMKAQPYTEPRHHI